MNLEVNKFYKFTWKSGTKGTLLKTVVVKVVEVTEMQSICMILAQKNCKFYRAGIYINIYPIRVEQNWTTANELPYEKAILEIIKEE